MDSLNVPQVEEIPYQSKQFHPASSEAYHPKLRSKSLVNINKGQRQTWDIDNGLKEIVESPLKANNTLRRGSLQTDNRVS